MSRILIYINNRGLKECVLMCPKVDYLLMKYLKTRVEEALKKNISNISKFLLQFDSEKNGRTTFLLIKYLKTRVEDTLKKNISDISKYFL